MCCVSFLKVLYYDVSNMYDLMMFVINGSVFMNWLCLLIFDSILCVECILVNSIIYVWINCVSYLKCFMYELMGVSFYI